MTRVALRNTDLQFCLNKLGRIMKIFPDKKDTFEQIKIDYPLIYNSIFKQIKSGNRSKQNGGYPKKIDKKDDISEISKDINSFKIDRRIFLIF